MLTLASAGLHGSHDVYTWLLDLAAARRPDLVVLAGDLLGFPDA